MENYFWLLKKFEKNVHLNLLLICLSFIYEWASASQCGYTRAGQSTDDADIYIALCIDGFCPNNISFLL